MEIRVDSGKMWVYLGHVNLANNKKRKKILISPGAVMAAA